MSHRQEGLAGVYEPGRSFDEASARDVLGRPFGSDVTPEVVAAGPLAVARTPRGASVAGRSSARTQCLLVGRLFNLEEIAESGVDGDVEGVLATAFEREGDAILQRLEGSFVVVLWDTIDQRGVIAQDRLGVRSVYYHDDSPGLRFASDVGLLMRMLLRRPAPSPDAVACLLAGALLPPESTPYEGIRKVTAAHEIEVEGGRWRRRRYWEPRYRTPTPAAPGELATALWDASRRAVGARIAGDDRPGIIMSGGLDSAVVAAAAAAERSGREFPRTYSAVFPGRARLDESPRIDLLADSLDLTGVQLEVESRGVFAVSLEYLGRWDLPLTGPGYLVEHGLVARAAADGVTTLLDGQGGNEIYEFSPHLVADRLRHGRILSSIRLARSFPAGGRPPSWRGSLRLWRRFGLEEATPDRLRRLRRRHGPSTSAPDYLSEDSARRLFEADDPVAWKRDAGGPLWWAWKAYATTRLWEESRLPEYLRHRAAMWGLEARPPLMDTRLVELALSIPPERNFDGSFDRPIMREGLRGRVPDAVRLWQEKSNLAPLYHDAVLADLDSVQRLVGDGSAEIRAFVRPDRVAELLEQPPSSRTPGFTRWMGAIWSLVNVEFWLREQRDPGFAERTLASGLFTPPRTSVHRTRP